MHIGGMITEVRTETRAMSDKNRCAMDNGKLENNREGKNNMRQTKIRKSNQKLSVDIEELAGMLSCGHATARKIGEDAEARIMIGRRVLYSVSKVERYLDAISA